MFNKDVLLVNKYKKNYFEGWYLKVDTSELSVAIIIGFSHISETDKHAFIQVFSTIDHQMVYHRFAYEDFHASDEKLLIKIKDNIITEHGIDIDIPNFKLSATFKNIKPFDKNKLGIMGLVQYLPQLECFHAIVSMHQSVSGMLCLHDVDYHIEGLGYMEKDYGTSMPKWWIWSHMADETSAFMISLASVRYKIHDFDGSLGYFYHDGEYHTFASYTRLKIKKSKKDNTIKIIGESPKYKFILKTTYKDQITLKAPVNGVMNRDIKEALNATSTLEFYHKKDKTTIIKAYQRVSLEEVGIITYDNLN